MILGGLTILIMLIVGYAYWREGLLTAFCMCCNVIVSGLVAFNFWEPIADTLDPMVAGSFLQGYEDFLGLSLFFIATLLLLRWLTNQLANRMPEFPSAVQHAGGVVFAMATGYLLAGFLVCVLQTLPWHERFVDFNPDYDPNLPGASLRRVLPPDRVWLAMMHKLSSDHLDWQDKNSFDQSGNFELRYARYRRYNDTRDNPLPYRGESPP
jgi:uncharacterized membrane protein required for colicin V production